MIYALKNIAAFLLPPGIFILLFFFVSILIWRTNRFWSKILMGITLFFYIFSTSYVSSYLVHSLESRYTVPETIHGDVIIMLGGGATAETPDIDGEGNLSGSAANRLLMAARLQHQLKIPIVVSGGKVFSDSGREALVAKRMLMGIGVAEEKIIIEDNSLNTRQNAQLVHEIMKQNGYEKAILVTSAFHMERSMMNFKKEGIDALPVPTDYLVSGKNDFYVNKMVPSSFALQTSCIFFHEWLGILGGRVMK
ncbi:YdcF family protein [Anaerosinus gibii]|uniref:YdcF family protein n=1 Tax=Selenobaculum gibii TaxID=3054208 RepID=A0A9Y2AHR7_9FIRM|nr:YdcF family protein [Selenobaculum gbiensis]WIW69996.1 YdcF family protein [Selenobaculum gbiensis]